jgi:hypothetical protein
LDFATFQDKRENSDYEKLLSWYRERPTTVLALGVDGIDIDRHGISTVLSDSFPLHIYNSKDKRSRRRYTTMYECSCRTKKYQDPQTKQKRWRFELFKDEIDITDKGDSTKPTIDVRVSLGLDVPSSEIDKETKRNMGMSYMIYSSFDVSYKTDIIFNIAYKKKDTSFVYLTISSTSYREKRISLNEFYRVVCLFYETIDWYMENEGTIAQTASLFVAQLIHKRAIDKKNCRRQTDDDNIIRVEDFSAICRGRIEEEEEEEIDEEYVRLKREIVQSALYQERKERPQMRQNNESSPVPVSS